MALKVTGSDRETARFLLETLRPHLAGLRSDDAADALVAGLARFVAFTREQTLACARIDAERLPKNPVPRRGLLREIRAAFDMAIDMCGSGPPDGIEEEKERLKKLCDEVTRALKGGTVG